MRLLNVDQRVLHTCILEDDGKAVTFPNENSFGLQRVTTRNKDMAIRPAQEEDLPAIRRCAREAYSIYVDRIGREPAPMIANFENQIRDGVVHVAENEDAQLLGFIVFYPREDHMHLENVAVSSMHQGKGVGRCLIEFCEAAAIRSGISKIELYTNEMMTENLRLYPRLGYREIGRWSEDGFNRVFFRKRIS